MDEQKCQDTAVEANIFLESLMVKDQAPWPWQLKEKQNDSGWNQ